MEPAGRTVDAGRRDAGRNDAGDDAGADTGADTGMMAVDGGPMEDAGPIDGGHDAGPTDAGYDAGPQACGIGFTGSPGMCRPVISEPSTRTGAEVCAMWNRAEDGIGEGAFWTHDAGDSCDLGTLAPRGYREMLDRTNLYRWLVGLAPVENAPERHEAAQSCAVMMLINDRISRSPASSWSCYTAEGAAVAARANLLLGALTPSSAIDLQVRSVGIPELDYRRWLLHGPLAEVGLGLTGGSTCVDREDTSGTTARSWIAYPNEGYAPLPTGQAAWSLHIDDASFGAATDAVVTRLNDGVERPVDLTPIPGGARWPALEISPANEGSDPWRPAHGETYRVSVSAHGSPTLAAPFVYEVSFVDC